MSVVDPELDSAEVGTKVFEQEAAIVDVLLSELEFKKGEMSLIPEFKMSRVKCSGKRYQV